MSVRTAAWLAALVVLATACGGDSGGRETVSEDPPVTNADLGGQSDGDEGEQPHAVELEEDAVIAAHRSAMDVRIESAASPEPDPDFPALEETHTDPMLTEWQELLVGMSLDGLAMRYPDDSELEVQVLDVSFSQWVDDEAEADEAETDADAGADEVGEDEVGDRATLQVCIYDDGETYDVATGEARRGGLYTIHEETVMRKVDGAWKVAERTSFEEEGRQACQPE